jgi:hypothetical protein
MLRFDDGFPSGSGETLLLPEHTKIGDLKLLAQEFLGKRFLKLFTAKGQLQGLMEIT